MLTIAVWIGVGIVIAMVVLWVLKFLLVDASCQAKGQGTGAMCLLRSYAWSSENLSLLQPAWVDDPKGIL
jgi:hypothetical protein